MMCRSVLQLLVVAIVALSVVEAKPRPSSDRSRQFTIVYYDNSEAALQKTITVDGQFRHYGVCKKAISDIGVRRADWCGFGLELVKNYEIIKYWTTEERESMRALMMAADCFEREEKNMYAKQGLKEDSKKGELSDKEKQAYEKEVGEMAIWIAMGLGGFCSVLLVILVVLLLVYCGGTPTETIEEEPRYYRPPSRFMDNRHAIPKTHKSRREARNRTEEDETVGSE